MKDKFSPRKKDVYTDEHFTVLPKAKPINLEETEIIEGFRIFVLPEVPRKTQKIHTQKIYTWYRNLRFQKSI